MTRRTNSAPDPRFDRLCDGFATATRADVPWETQDRRGALDLDRDGAQHRRYHSLYEDMQN